MQFLFLFDSGLFSLLKYLRYFGKVINLALILDIGFGYKFIDSIGIAWWQTEARKVNLFPAIVFFVSQFVKMRKISQRRKKSTMNFFIPFERPKLLKSDVWLLAEHHRKTSAPHRWCRMSVGCWCFTLVRELKTEYLIGYDNHKQTRDGPKGNEQWTFWTVFPPGSICAMFAQDRNFLPWRWKTPKAWMFHQCKLSPNADIWTVGR